MSCRKCVDYFEILRCRCLCLLMLMFTYLHVCVHIREFKDSALLNGSDMGGLVDMKFCQENEEELSGRGMRLETNM